MMRSNPRFLVHIGRHKTGTSSLQHFLCINRSRLEELGFYYPSSGLAPLAHHDIARHFFSPRARMGFTEGERERHTHAFRDMLREVANRSDIVLLSSEGFQNCNPKPLARALATEDARIVVYIREQVEYLVSAYQQKVHATNFSGSLLQFSERFSINYDAFLKHWEQAFGQVHMTVRTYGKRCLKDGDVISDFCHSVGIADGPSLLRPESDQNPSIGGPLLELKRRLNSIFPQQITNGRLYSALSELAATNAAYRTRPELPYGKAAEIRKAVAASNERVFERYPDIAMGFGEPVESSDVQPVAADRDADNDIYASVLTEFAERSPALHQALLDKARSALGLREGASATADWAEILRHPDLMPNAYPAVHPYKQKDRVSA